MKRLCFVNYDMTVTGGVEQVTTALANAFCREYEVYIFAIFGRNGEVAFDFDRRIHYYAHLAGDCRIRTRIVKVFTPFKNFVEQNKIDVVFLMENHPALTVSPVRFVTKAKYVFCDHGALMNEWEKKDITAFRFWDSLIAHRTVTLTEQNRRDYICKFHTKPANILSIPNWIRPEVLACRESYDAETKKIITVGRFSEEKGYDLLVRAAARILPRFPEWEWHLFGEGDTMEATRCAVQNAGISDQVIFHGNVKDVYQKFHEYAFLVLPSYREGLPLVLLEAKACGLPMISFDVTTGPREIIQNGKDGDLIAPYDIDEMVLKMEYLMSDPEKRIRYSRHTQDDIEKFSKEKIYEQWKTLIEQLK